MMRAFGYIKCCNEEVINYINDPYADSEIPMEKGIVQKRVLRFEWSVNEQYKSSRCTKSNCIDEEILIALLSVTDNAETST